MRTISLLGVTAAMVFASGCCEMQTPQPKENAYQSVVLPLLTDLDPACPAPHLVAAQASIPLRTSGLPEERVYDLGDGLVANSCAITLAGSKTKPSVKYRSGGVGCASAKAEKPSTYTAPKPAAPSPVIASASAQVVTSGPAFVCPVPTDTAGLCIPGEFMSECFTLTEEEKRNGPNIYVPGTNSKYDARLDITMPVPPAELPAASSAASTPAVAAPAEPASTDSIPSAPGTDPAEKAEALDAVDALAAPVPAPEIAPTTTAPLAPPPEVADEPVSALPPVPVVSDLNQVAESVTPTPSDPSNLPEVVLPPKLN